MSEQPKIEELTPEQKERMPEFVDKWKLIGLDTTPLNREAVEKYLPYIYLGKQDDDGNDLQPPEKIEWCLSPWDCLKRGEEKYNLDREEMFKGFCYGQHDASWLAFYDYFREVCELKEQTEPISGLIEFSKHVGWFIPYDEVIFISEKPSSIYIECTETGEQYHSKDGICVSGDINNLVRTQFHRDGGPAIEFRDGHKQYYLHGVEMKEPELIELVCNDFDKVPMSIFKHENAEVRREFVRKVGIERIVEEFGCEVIDTTTIPINGIDHQYELLNLIVEDEPLPYLKMTNPSIGVFHIEGVPPGTKTVKQALEFRNGTDLPPMQLT